MGNRMVICPDCKTEFDYDKKLGYCPKCGTFYEGSVTPEAMGDVLYKPEAVQKSEVKADVYYNNVQRDSEEKTDIYQNASQQLYNNIDYKTDDVMYAPEYYNYLKEKYGVEDETKQRSIKIDANYYQNIKPGENPYTDSPYKDFYDTHLNRVNEGFNDPLYKAEKDRKARRDITRAAGICIIVLFLVITLFSCATKTFMREAYQGLFSVSDSYEK